MPSIITEHLLLEAAEASKNLSQAQLLDRIVLARAQTHPQISRTRIRNWAEHMVRRGRQEYGELFWPTVFREEDQDKAEAIIEALRAETAF